MFRKNRFEDVIRGFNVGQQEALLRKLFLAAGGDNSGEEGLRAILRDELAITLVDAVVKLVDANGRFIPLKGMRGGNDYIEPNRNFHLVQPAFATAPILARLQQFFPGLSFLPTEDFDRKVASLLEQIRAMNQMKGLLKGVHFPICLPQTDVVDYGEALEQVFLDAVKRSYETQFPGRTFNNYRAGTLKGKVGIVDESRHGRLIEMMKQKPVVGIYFPDALRSFSIPADRRIIQSCPDGFLLTGSIDTAIAMVAKPETLARDYNTPRMDCAANVWHSAYSLYFGPDGGRLVFDSRDLYPIGGYSGGLLFVG